jgi:ATP-dependent Clp protease ATP-binding subunit ClpA
MAKANAQAGREAFILPEHIFLGIAPDGVAAAAVQKLDSRLETLQAEIRQTLSAHQGEPEQSPRARNVIESAILAAKSLRRDYIGDEHILLALAEVESPVQSLLLSKGMTYDALKTAIVNLRTAAQMQNNE